MPELADLEDFRHGEGKLCCVIGSSGCLGRELVSELLRRGYNVHGFDLKDPVVDDERVTYFKGSLTSSEDLLPALNGVHVVFQTASPYYFTRNKSLFHEVNVKGTANVIKCCAEANVSRLVATGSGIVVFNGEDNCGKAEHELPFGTFDDAYQISKIEMEKLVVAANGTPLADGSGKLMTSVIRPQGVFGPGDSAVVPGLEQYQNWAICVGPEKNKFDYPYSTNVAHGHILAAEQLYPESPACGEVFNISNDDPVNYAEFLDKILVILGYRRAMRMKWIPVIFFTILAHIMLFFQKGFETFGVHLPILFSPMQIQMAVKSQYHSIEKAKRMLGYKPLVSMEEGLRRTAEYYKARRNSRKQQ